MKTWTVRVTYGCLDCASHWGRAPNQHEGCFTGLRGDPGFSDPTVATYDKIEAPTIAAARRRGILLYRLDFPTQARDRRKWRCVAHATENKGDNHG